MASKQSSLAVDNPQLDTVTDAVIEAEQAVIGSLLLDSDAVLRVRPILSKEAFYTERMRWIYDAILTLTDAGTPADFLTLCDELERRGQLQEVGGASKVMDLISCVPTAIHAEHYARIVNRSWLDREAIRLAGQIVQGALERKGNGLNIAHQLLVDARKRHSIVDEGPRPMTDIVAEMLEAAANHNEARADGREITIPTPFWQLNNNLRGGFMSGDVVTVFGQPGIGKSTFAHMCADYAAARRHGVLCFITEMNRQQYGARQLAPHAGIDSRTIRSGFMSEKQWAVVHSVAGQVARPNMLVDDKTFDVQQFGDRIGQAKLILDRIGQTLDLVVFDYLQLFKDTRRRDKRAEVSDIINHIRELANEHEIPVIVVSALAREGYKNDAKPNLYNLKESGDIEYATTIGLAMYRDSGSSRITMEIQKMRDGKSWQKVQLPPMVEGAAWYDVQNDVQRVAA